MLVTEVTEALPGGSSLLRNEPVQARSSARLTGLLDAAAAIIDEIGFERLTTAMVAERAGASIGTVYRYFPDRIAVVEALSVRGVSRLIERATESLGAAAGADWRVAVDVLVDSLVELYRSEPGFRAIRFGESDTPDRLGSGGRRPLAEQVSLYLADRAGVAPSPEVDFAVDVATELASGLVGRAFATDRAGDERFVVECRTIVRDHLERAFSAV
ncbi:Fatty acid metabolism regulator protein [Frondihabitans sp. 762G35]|uniref:TetR/AcrR family transcriptional regulator n=1 Tax=Frondihabitans sp. 762G35 TaxID=1446794 RepID=UPI000D206C7F|nr:TetR/AcrR family transcriptional regulator [Frondihabitans sp. 762G35]ARC57130.1 Fatty acid metabolism regulator protein [Frondihabitans sp. 762G35]